MNETQSPTPWPFDASSNDTTTSPSDNSTTLPFPENKNLLSEGARITGLVFMALSIVPAVGLGIWVVAKRQDSVVKAMQPIFLLLLCVGTIISDCAVVPLGVTDENTSMDDIEGVCLAAPWLTHLGGVVVLSALFSKLWRVNLIFHAEGFQRKVVTVVDVLKPFGILLGLNLVLLIVISTVDPPTWVREPIDESNPYSTVGYCTYDGWGLLAEFLLGIINFVALIMLCVQAYRARDIKSEFSEARGVALALFSWLQALIITVPALSLLEADEPDAVYMLNVMSSVIPSWSILFFVFAPLIMHQRARSRGNHTAASTVYPQQQMQHAGRTRISGLDCDPRMIGTTINATQPQTPTVEDPTNHEHAAVVSNLETEVQALRSRIAELEGDPRIQPPERQDKQ